jgi:hypothetical protein
MVYGEVCLNRDEFNKTGILLSTKPGGTCAYCGRAIRVLCHIESSDGRKFHVGSDCVEKTSTEYDKSLAGDVRKALAKRTRETRAAKAAALQASLASTAENRHQDLLKRLDILATKNSAFADMARQLRMGMRKDLSPAQLAWVARS